MKTDSSSKNTILILFAILVACLVGLVIWATFKAGKTDEIWPLVLDAEGNVALWLNEDIVLLNHDGVIISRWQLEREPDDENDVVVADMCFEEDGNYYIADRGNFKIKKYAKGHHLLWQVGKKGKSEGEFWGTVKICVHPQTGWLYVADTSNHRIQVFNEHGNFQFIIGEKGEDHGYFQFPNGVFFDAHGDLVVANTNNGRLDKFDKGGAYLSSIDFKGKVSPFYEYPVCAAIDGDGNFHVLFGTGPGLKVTRAYKSDAEGNLLFEFDEGFFPGLINKLAIADGKVIIACQDKMQILTFTLEGEYSGTFGAESIAAELKEMYQERTILESIRTWGRIVLVVFLLILLLLYYLQRKKQKRAPEQFPSPRERRPAPVLQPQRPAKRRQAAIRSLLYPGLGQFYNGSLGKGIFFITIHTASLFLVARVVVTWYSRYAEVDPFSFIFPLACSLTIWSMAVVDAYNDFLELW